tara:strand:- start:308 stop:1234 length:927 start_codon:yes stop_codon:yes gene_type:complete
MKQTSSITLLISLILLLNSYSYSIENKILLKINNKIITSFDLYNEIKILKLLNNNISDLSEDKIIKIASKSLTKQAIKELELSKYSKNLELPKEYLNSYLLNYAKKLNFNTKEDFLEYFEKNMIDTDALKKKITIDLLWNQFVYARFLKNVKIDENKIREEISKKKFINEYLLSEIVFNVESKNDIKIIFDSIKESIKKDGFNKTALTYSTSSTSQNGGNLGWIKETSLSETVRKILKDINIDQFTKPIQIPGGFLILYVQNIKKIKSNLDINKETENIVKLKTNKQLDQFSNIYFNKIKKNFIINEF